MIRFIILHTHDHASLMIPVDRILRKNQTNAGSQVWLGRRMDSAEKLNVIESVEEIAEKIKEVTT